MDILKNVFRDGLRAGQNKIGLWVGFPDPNVAEALGSCGFDWLLLDAEHSPNDVRNVLAQLRALAASPVHPIVRPVQGEVALIKQYLDIGAQTLLVPMVDTSEHAALLARAMRYPPQGIRGVGAALARASRWNQIDRYLDRADDEVCLLVQVETPKAIANLAAIAATPGVDGVFFGPADLSAAMGYRGQPGHPNVQLTIIQGISTVKAAGKAAGVLAADQSLARAYLAAGAQFVAVGSDTSLLVRAASELAAGFSSKIAHAQQPDYATRVY